MAALPRDVIKHLETQLPLLHLEREYTPHTRPRTDPVSGQTLPGNALTGFAFRVCWGVRADFGFGPTGVGTRWLTERLGLRARR